jgi:hypothetical protein
LAPNHAAGFIDDGHGAVAALVAAGLAPAELSQHAVAVTDIGVAQIGVSIRLAVEIPILSSHPAVAGADAVEFRSIYVLALPLQFKLDCQPI